MKADENRRMFDQIARRYDFVNAVISMGLDRFWRGKAVSVLAPLAGKWYLDIGCGTGAVALEVERRAPGATVTGIDPSANMLDAGRVRVKAAGFENAISFMQADAAALPFDNGLFAGAVSAFCVRNIDDLPRAFREIRRVLTPEAPFVILELTVPGNPVLRFGHRLYTRILLPLAGRIFAREDAYRYLVNSIERFARPAEVVNMLGDAGFHHVRHVPLSGGIVTIISGRA